MKALISRLLEMQDNPYLNKLACELNIRNITVVAVLVFVFQLSNLFDETFYTKPVVIVGFVAVILLCIVFTFLSIKNRDRYAANPRSARIVYMSFWLGLIVVMTPFYIADIVYTSLPINLLLVAFAAAIVPLFIRFEIFLAYGLLVAINITVALANGAGYPYMTLVTLSCVAGLAISYIFKQQHLHIIVRLQEENRLDPLTGALNRRGGLEKMDYMLGTCKRHGELVAVYMIDIDYFKHYNDTYGHKHGDEILIEVAGIIERTFERRSDVVCRYGGEEFFVSAAVDSENTAMRMAETLGRAIYDENIPSPTKELSDRLTVSTGFIVFDPGDDAYPYPADLLIEKADKAMYAAKQAGRNRIVKG